MLPGGAAQAPATQATAIAPSQASQRLCTSCGAVFDMVRARVGGGAAQQGAATATAATATAVAAVQAAGPDSTSPPLGAAGIVAAFVASPLFVKVNCGLIGGVSQAGLFNPWDRALYLSVKHNRPFLAVANFSKPYQGFWQAIVQRTFSTGLYFPLEDLFMGPCEEALGKSGVLAHLVAGNLAGAINGVMLNPASAVKYQTWGQENASFWRTARLMWQEGGVAPFLKGTHPTILRDLTFGGVYSLLRNRVLSYLEETHGLHRTSTEAFVANVLAAGVATTVSGPFNYVRNIKYSYPADMTPPGTMVILRDLWEETRTRATLLESMELLQNRLRIGWGTTRVAVGMGFTHQVYEVCKHTTASCAGAQCCEEGGRE